jgi:hypothetical protein
VGEHVEERRGADGMAADKYDSAKVTGNTRLSFAWMRPPATAKRPFIETSSFF